MFTTKFFLRKPFAVFLIHVTMFVFLSGCREVTKYKITDEVQKNEPDNTAIREEFMTLRKKIYESRDENVSSHTDSVQGTYSVIRPTDSSMKDSIYVAWNLKDPEYLEIIRFRNDTPILRWRKDRGAYVEHVYEGYEPIGTRADLLDFMLGIEEELDQ